MQALADFWEMITGANLNAVIAVFTIAIAGTTVAYTLVTWWLLRQSRWAFLVDALIRVMQRVEDRQRWYVDKIREDMAKSFQEEELRRELGRDMEVRWADVITRWDTLPYLEGVCKVLEGMNKKLGQQFHKAIDSYVKGPVKTKKDILGELIDVRDEIVKRRVAAVKKIIKTEEKSFEEK